MLPSTGKFKEFNCPFFDNGLCERPYCHFRHIKKDLSEILQSASTTKGSLNQKLTLEGNGEIILHQLISNAVRKVLEQTDLPSALVRQSESDVVERVSRNLVSEVPHVLTPHPCASSTPRQNYSCNVPSQQQQPQQKVPSYNPTPISVLKNRHIPIPYYSNLTKGSTRLKKRPYSTETVLQTNQYEHTGRTSVSFSPSAKVYEPSNASTSKQDSALNISHSFQYYPTAVKGWKHNEFNYTLSDSLKQRDTEDNEYSEESYVEPTYDLFAPSSIAGENDSYELSLESLNEPEYQSSFCNNTSKKHVINDVPIFEGLPETNLNISPKNHTLSDTLHEELNYSDSENVKKRTGSREEERAVHLDCDAKTSSSVESSKNDKHESEIEIEIIELDRNTDQEKLGSYRKKSEDKKQTKSDRKENSKKESVCDKIKDKEKYDGKKQDNSSRSKNRKEHDRKKDNSDKKKESRRKSELNEKDSKRSGHNNKTTDIKLNKYDKKSGEKKRDEIEVKESHSEATNREYRKDKSSKNTSYTQHSKTSMNSEQEKTEKKSSSSSSKHKHRSHKLVSEKDPEKENHVNKKYIHKKDDYTIKSQKSNLEEKLSKTEKCSKSNNSNLKRKCDSVDHKNSKKIKPSHTTSKSESSREVDGFTNETAYQDSLSDCEASDTDILDKVTIPKDTLVSSSDEDELAKECYRIFEEYKPNNVENIANSSYIPPQQDEEISSVPGKRRIAHEGAQNRPLISPIRRPAVVNPSQMLSERFQKVRESHPFTKTQTQDLGHTQRQGQGQMLTHSHGLFPSLSCVPRKRIAHVPNVSLLLDAKLKIQQQLKERLSSESVEKGSNAFTKAHTVTKGMQRIAHVPSEHVLARPVVKSMGGKIPSNVRQNYLDIIVDEYLKITTTNKEAYEKAEQEEKAICDRSSTRGIYVSHVSNAINRLRKAIHNSSASSSGKIAKKTVLHASMLAGKISAKGSWSIEKPRKLPADIANKSLYELLSQFIMTEEQLKQYGFPRSHTEEKGVAVIHNVYKKPFIHKTLSQRMCDRCSKIYNVDRKGCAEKQELCVYHWGRFFQSKRKGIWEASYNCCQSSENAIGCSVGNCHVSDNFDPNNLRGYVKTLPKEEPSSGDYGVYALDCEMCYTTVGLELTRVSVVDADLNIVYNSFVKPESIIIDYNTRFSGIKEEDLENVTTNIYEVQSILLSFISEKTILVGHSLESDLKALKLIHSTVVDTSVVYPHKMGLPKKRALKTLCREILQKIIQENDDGHDSVEDARAAMEIMICKVKEEMKTAW